MCKFPISRTNVELAVFSPSCLKQWPSPVQPRIQGLLASWEKHNHAGCRRYCPLSKSCSAGGGGRLHPTYKGAYELEQEKTRTFRQYDLCRNWRGVRCCNAPSSGGPTCSIDCCTSTRSNAHRDCPGPSDGVWWYRLCRLLRKVHCGPCKRCHY